MVYITAFVNGSLDCGEVCIYKGNVMGARKPLRIRITIIHEKVASDDCCCGESRCRSKHWLPESVNDLLHNTSRNRPH